MALATSVSARELTGGFGVHSVLECVGLEQSTLTAISIARPGGAVGPVGVPQNEMIARVADGPLRQRDDRRRTRPGARLHGGVAC